MGAIVPELPRKTIIFGGVFGLMIITAAGLVVREKMAEAKEGSGTLSAVQVQTEALELDSDSDGLKDWEEALWKTDINRADTDGDGSTDATEVAQNHDPLVPGTGASKLAATSTAQSAPLTTTDILSREFFANYAALRQSGNLSESSGQELVAKLLDDAENKVVIVTTVYTQADILTSTDASNDALIAYRERLNTIIGKHSYKALGSELETVQAAMNAQDEKLLAPLAKAHKAYAAITKELLAVSTPKSLVDLHLSFVNSFNALAESSKKMSESIADPIIAVFAVEAYRKASDQLLVSFDVKI